MADDLKPWNTEPGPHVLLLQPGETTTNPASTVHLIHGPAKIEYRVYDHGGVTFTVFDLDE